MQYSLKFIIIGEKCMEQWSNQKDICAEEDVEINIAKDTNIKIIAHVIENEELFINILMNNKVGLDILINATNVYVHEKLKTDIIIFTNKSNTNSMISRPKDGEHSGYIPIKKHSISQKEDIEILPYITDDGKYSDNKTKVKIQAFTYKKQRICIIVYSNPKLDIYIDTRKPKIREMLSDREYRQAAHKRKNNMYKFKQFDKLWLDAYLLKPEYILTIAQTSLQAYSLYDIICYNYIGNYFDEGYLINLKNTSLRNLVSEISATHIKDKNLYPIENEDENISNPVVNHFKSFTVLAERKLEKFFQLIFEATTGLNIFKANGKIQFNVFDYGFISYLLSEKSHYDIQYFTEKCFESVSSEFYAKIYIGLNLMTITHDIPLDKKKIENLFINQFHRDVKQIQKDIEGFYHFNK